MTLGIGRLDINADYGVIEKCPHCDKTNIRKTVKHQITCGSPHCRALQANLRRGRLRAKTRKHA